MRQLSDEIKRMQFLAGIVTETSTNRYELIDPSQSEDSLNTLLDAIELLNQNGLQATPVDKSGHYSGGYQHINSIYFTSNLSFQELIRKANDLFYMNGLQHLRILQA